MLVLRQGAPAVQAGEKEGFSTLLLNVTSSGKADPHAVTMALQLANHAIEDGRKVVLFFNVRGVDVAARNFPGDLGFHDRPIAQLLADLMAKGAEVQVCPHCMQGVDLKAESFVLRPSS